MRFIIILCIALSLTLAWQTTLLASSDSDLRCGVSSSLFAGKDGEKKTSGADEPECE